MNLIDDFKQLYSSVEKKEYTIDEFLELCKEDPSCYATAPERMLKAIGEPTIVDTSSDPRLSRIFSNRTIKLYPAFKDFFGMEKAIEEIVSFFKHAAQGLEESKNILYLLGPVGSAKSSLAERLKSLMEKEPMYVLKHKEKGLSPLFESPLGMFNKTHFEAIERDYSIPKRYLEIIPSPWAVERLVESQGNLNDFTVVKLYPSILRQIGITKTEPGDDNNQDISALVGKVDIRQLEHYSQDHPDAYSYKGGLNVSTQGLLEFIEMFKAPLKMLHPLLTATQESHYNGTQGFGAMPYQGIILAHSNMSEWESFKNDNKNEAFIDRVCVIKVPYCLRIDEEVKIYEKLISHSNLKDAAIAPGTLEMMAKWSILTRLVKPENSHIHSKMRIYNGENLKDVDPKAKSLVEYKEAAGVDEGMNGMSTRFAYKILSKVFNFDTTEISANPIHLMFVLEKTIIASQLGKEVEDEYLSFIKGILAPDYAEFVGDEIQKAYLESYAELCQAKFDRYILFADHWIQDNDYRDPDTGEQFDRSILNAELEKIEKASGIANPKDYRSDVVNYALREKANNGGNNPKWNSYEKLKTVIEKHVFTNMEELLPVISFGAKKTSTDSKKHAEFVERMQENGYTEKQVRLAVDWWMRFVQHN